MDRREALKKLGVGSAVVVGASTVKSLPAFAFANPVITGALDVTVNGNQKTTSATISSGTATCTGSAIAPCGTCASTDAEVTAMSMTAFLVSVTTAGTRYGWGSTAAAAVANEFTPTSGVGATVSVTVPSPYTDPADGWGIAIFPFRHFNAAGSSVIDAQSGDTILITGYIEYQCTYGDGIGSVSDTVNLYFTKNGTNGGWIVSAA